MTKRDGGPAFPLADGTRDDEGGMTLRDYFAGQAIAGLCCRDATRMTDTLAQEAFEVADAMLAERNKEKS